MIILIVLFSAPLVSASLVLLVHLYWHKATAQNKRRATSMIIGWIASMGVFISCLMITVSFFIFDGPTTVILSSWLPLYFFDVLQEVNIAFYVDQLTLIMLSFIGGIALLIHIYSIIYMKHHEGIIRYFVTLNLFMFFMFLLVLANNLLLLFVGWEGVGLCSYLLIGHYHQKKEATLAANKAFLMNRIGDAFFLMGIFYLFWLLGSIDLQMINESVSTGWLSEEQILMVGILLFLGACGKSAQFPLLTWLPNAMTGPTPVSALIHAATMVTAGVYLVIRLQAVFFSHALMLQILLLVGLVTMLLGSIYAIIRTDIKKILAYSTISQLGFMFAALGLAASSEALTHLFSHSFYKGLLFLSAGLVIHLSNGEQDIYRIRSQLHHRSSPLPWIVFLVGCLALAGIFPFNGYFSKSAIIQVAEGKDLYLWLLFEALSVLTIIYSARLWMILFWRTPRSAEKSISHYFKTPLVILASMTFLTSIIILPSHFFQSLGIYMNSHPFSSFNLIDYFENTLDQLSLLSRATSNPSWISIVEGISISFIALFASIAYYSYSLKKTNLADQAQPSVFEITWLDQLHSWLIIQPLQWCGSTVLATLEKINLRILYFVSFKMVVASGKWLAYLGLYIYRGGADRLIMIAMTCLSLVLLWEIIHQLRV